MFVDTSAFVAIISKESDWLNYVDAIQSAEYAVTSGLVKLEAVMVLSRLSNSSNERNHERLNQLIAAAAIDVVDLNNEVSELAIEAFTRFGKGQDHPARLNLSDCMTYGAAKFYQIPILFKGEDFSKTDALIARV